MQPSITSAGGPRRACGATQLTGRRRSAAAAPSGAPGPTAPVSGTIRPAAPSARAIPRIPNPRAGVLTVWALRPHRRSTDGAARRRLPAAAAATAAAAGAFAASASSQQPAPSWPPIARSLPRRATGAATVAAVAAGGGGGEKLAMMFRAGGSRGSRTRTSGGGREVGGEGSSPSGAGGAAAPSSGAGGSGGAGGGVFRAAVGIDLGTTTSAVAVAGPDGRPMVVEDEAGRAIIPSVVFVRQDGSVLVGEEASAAAETDPANAFYGIKRLMGRTYREALREADAAREEPSPPHATGSPPGVEVEARGARGRLRSYTLVEGAGGAVEVECPALGRSLTPQEVSAHLLRNLISRARAFLERQLQHHRQQQQQHEQRGEAAGGDEEQGGAVQVQVQVLDAVITVPAHYGPAQRRAVSEAARAAGLQRVTLLQEPIAAAMAYGFGSPHVPYDVLLVFDLGGGTLDLSVVEAFEGIMEVLSTSGDNYLGGDDFTAAIADWLQFQLQLQLQQQQLQQNQEPSPSSAPLHTSALSAEGPPPPTAAFPAAPVSTTSTSSTSTSAAAAAAAAPPSSHSLALLRAAEAAKLALSEAVAAARDGSSSNDSGGGSGGGVSVRVRLPSRAPSSGGGGGGAGGVGWGTPPSSPAGEVELSLESFAQLVRPLLQRMWWPLEGVALATRTQLGGRLPQHLDPRGSGSGSRPASGGAPLSGSISGSGSLRDSEGPGRREGAASWEFSIFPPPPSPVGGAAAAAGAAAKYVAPPRRLSGLVLVGAATRLPVVRDYITEVTGLPVRPGVDPETAVAVGAALHAGLMVGSVTGGIEMNDGGYVSEQHGRASGFQVAAGEAAYAAGGAPAALEEPELVWEP